MSTKDFIKKSVLNAFTQYDAPKLAVALLAALALGRIKFVVKSKTMRGENTEMAVEVFCNDPNVEFADRVRAVEGVQDVTLIQYNGEYHG